MNAAQPMALYLPLRVIEKERLILILLFYHYHFFLDNVHFQNAAQLAAALVRDKIKFRGQVSLSFFILLFLNKLIVVFCVLVT